MSANITRHIPGDFRLKSLLYNIEFVLINSAKAKAFNELVLFKPYLMGWSPNQQAIMVFSLLFCQKEKDPTTPKKNLICYRLCSADFRMVSFFSVSPETPLKLAPKFNSEVSTGAQKVSTWGLKKCQPGTLTLFESSC